MSDPLHDPRFPDRPQHPDFWRLSETAMMLDGKAAEGDQEIPIIVSDLVDVDSLTYMAENRVNILLDALHLNPSDKIRRAMVTSMLGGIVHGIAFEKAGGHRAD